MVGLFWSTWYYPGNISGLYGVGAPFWIALPGFALDCTGASFFRTVLVSRSGSFSPGAILHVSHNIFLMGIKMKHSIESILLILSVGLIITCCENREKKIDKEAELQEIAKVVDNAIGWFKKKDFDLSFRTFAQDSNFLEVHPDGEVVKGFEQFKKNSEIFKNPEFLYVRHEIWDQKINLSEAGNTAWFFCMLNDISTWKGQQVGWENTRWTGVLEKREGRWVIVQQHFSFAGK